MNDVQVLADQVFAAVKSYISQRFAAINAKLDERIAPLAIEVASVKASIPTVVDGKNGIDGKDGLPGRDGKDGEPGAPGERGEMGQQGPQGPAGRDGVDGKDGEPGGPGDPGEPGKEGPPGPSGRDGVDGKDGKDGLHGKDGVPGEPGLSGKDGRDGVDGKDAEPINYAIIREAIDARVAEIPRPRDGVDGKDGKDGRDGVDGKDAPPVDVIALKYDLCEFIEPSVEAAVKAIPIPKDGVDGKDGRDGEPGPPGIEGKQGPAGKDGVDGKDVDPDEIVTRVLDLVPSPKDGLAGKDGVDGRDGRDGPAGPAGRDALHLEVLPSIDVSRSYPRSTYAYHEGGMIRAFRSTDPIKASLEEAGWMVVQRGIADESEELEEDGRTLVRTTRYTGGATFVRKFKLRMQIYRGVWRAGVDYDAGDTVTVGGSEWHADKDVESVPGAPEIKPGMPGSADNWTLCVKRGRDGKDGKDGKDGMVGKDGPPGRDLTHIAPDGSKYV